MLLRAYGAELILPSVWTLRADLRVQPQAGSRMKFPAWTWMTARSGS